MPSPHPPTFDALYDRLAARVLALGFQLTGDRSLAEEVLQETFFAVHRSLRRFRGEADPATWVYRIALNAGRRIRDRRARDVRNSTLRPAADPPGADTLPETQALFRALDQLPSDQREVLCLLALRSVPARVIAELLDIPVGTVHSRAFHARDTLRRILASDGRQDQSPCDASTG